MFDAEDVSRYGERRVNEIAQTASSRREPWLRRTMTDPFSPLVIVALLLTLAVVVGAVWPIWVLFAAVAGHSLSGST